MLDVTGRVASAARCHRERGSVTLSAFACHCNLLRSAVRSARRKPGGCGGHQPLDQVVAETLSAVDLPVVASGSIGSAARVIHREVVATVAERSLPPFAPVPPTGAAHGEISAMPTYAGTSVGDVDVTMPAATIVPELTAGLEVPNAR
jgi:hypothetical protein